MPPLPPEPEPKEDLRLTGLIEIKGGRMALFTVTEPGKPNSYFTVCEGEQNDWLEVKSVNVKEGTIKARLKKPVVRERRIGVEVPLSLHDDGPLSPLPPSAPYKR